MGLLKRKRKEIPEPPSPTKFQRMPAEDVYLLIETSLMTAQQQLSEYRSTPLDMRASLLSWMTTNVATAELGCQELLVRNITP
jgi:hypothetical protein